MESNSILVDKINCKLTTADVFCVRLLNEALQRSRMKTKFYVQYAGKDKVYIMKSITVYFSRAGQNYVNGEIKELKTGNTETAALLLQKETGCELFKIEPAVSYSEIYSECVKEAVADMKSGARPEPVSWPENMEQYDTVYLAYPNYCGTMPMILFTFLEKYDFTGKKICPLCTNEGSGMGRSEEDIKRLCPGADVRKGLSVHGAEAEKAGDAIRSWLETCG